MSELLESVTFTDVLGRHTISLEKFDSRELEVRTTLPKSVKSWRYVVTEYHHYTFREVNPETNVTVSAVTQKTVTADFINEDKARSHFQHVYREQNGKETIKGITNYAVKAIGNSGNSVSVAFWGVESKTLVMTTRAFDSLGKLAHSADVFDVEFLYYTNTSIADDVIVITPNEK